MKITRRQLKRIIREEYSLLKSKGLINESMDQRAQVDRFVQDNIESYGSRISDLFYRKLARAQGLSHFEAMLKYDEELYDIFVDLSHDCNQAGIKISKALGYIREQYAVPSATERSRMLMARDPDFELFKAGIWYDGSL